MTVAPKLYLVAAGDYETGDKRFRLYRHVGVNPPAWTLEDTRTNRIIVDGAASKADAVDLFCEWWQGITA